MKKGGSFKSYVAFTDNLGSILLVVDENGSKFFDASYSAWGRKTVKLNTIGLHRGYCGHEMLNEFNLINMNGRIYDPVLGSFLSPDNYVQMPDNSQNFNRYSYCLNNPFKYTDFDALDKGTNFWTGNTHLDLEGAYSCIDWDPEGLVNKLKNKTDNIVGKYVGNFEGQNVYESELLGTYSKGNYSGFTLPDRGICVGRGVFTSCTKNGRAMMQHEFGHVLQYRIVGERKYYTVIAKESLINCTLEPSTHDTFWTETWANYLSKQHFGTKWYGFEYFKYSNRYRYYPSKNINKVLMKEKFGM